ncbi:MAG: FHA domain-containing protein [bacterium]
MESKICSCCKHTNTSNNHFCTQCGSRLDDDYGHRPRLRLLYGEPKGAVFVLGQRQNTIGRDSGNLIVLGDEQVSNKHAAITLEDENYWIEDFNSKNGIFVNGKKVSKREQLINRSLIKMGATIMRFETSY